jgi:hypothetical protein
MIDGVESVLPLSTVKCELPFGAIYDRVAFLPEQLPGGAPDQ